MNGFWIIYILGGLWGWWYLARAIVTDVRDSGRGDGVVPAIFFLGLISAVVWPVVAVGRIGYILYKRYVPPGAGGTALERVFPSIKPAKTYRDLQAAKLDKRSDELAQREKWVEERELELR